MSENDVIICGFRKLTDGPLAQPNTVHQYIGDGDARPVFRVSPCSCTACTTHRDDCDVDDCPDCTRVEARVGAWFTGDDITHAPADQFTPPLQTPPCMLGRKVHAFINWMQEFCDTFASGAPLPSPSPRSNGEEPATVEATVTVTLTVTGTLADAANNDEVTADMIRTSLLVDEDRIANAVGLDPEWDYPNARTRYIDIHVNNYRRLS